MTYKPDNTTSLDTLLKEAKATKYLVTRSWEKWRYLDTNPDDGDAIAASQKNVEHAVLCARWLADAIIDVVGEAQPCGFEPPRFAKELDSFELFNTMIARTDMRPLAAMLIRAVDDAEQLRFECPEYHQEAGGFFIERGFRRCKQCGYPGQ